MKPTTATAAVFAGLGRVAFAQVPGFDISDYQPPPYDFASAYADGARFAIIKVIFSP